MPIGQAREAVPFGQVLRGGGPSAFFYIDADFPLHEFRDDWTAVHELAHMLLPYVGSSNRWLSEGVASYYQNVLRARSGMISDESAWAKLLGGFDRGRRQSGAETLRRAGNGGWRNSIMRIYWSGAALSLLADIGYRVETDGEASMDTTLRALSECCLPSPRRWSVNEVTRRLDASGGHPVWQDLVDRWLDDPAFPDVDAELADLGVVLRGGSVTLRDDAPLAHIRRAIMLGPQGIVVQSSPIDGPTG